MHVMALGFWGAFFGTAALMLAGALAAFAQANRRVAIGAAIPPLGAAIFVVTYLGWLPISDRDVEARVAAHVAIFIAVVLWLTMLVDLGRMRSRADQGRILLAAAIVVPAAVAIGWWLEPRQSAVYGAIVGLAATLGALPVAVHSARRGDRVAWFGAAAIVFILLGLACGLLIELDREGAPWPLHALGATAAIAYLCCAALMMWQRYAYLIELREARVHGPDYDPVTRMPATAATGVMVAKAFRSQQHASQAVVLIAVSLGNLPVLEHLHGRAALNHALFVCASRLRRCVPAAIEMARLFEDGFLLVSRDGDELPSLAELARQLVSRLGRPVMLRTDGAPGEQAQWSALVGIGVLVATTPGNPAALVAKARALSRTAWTHDRGVAWQDLSGEGVDDTTAPGALTPRGPATVNP